MYCTAFLPQPLLNFIGENSRVSVLRMENTKVNAISIWFGACSLNLLYLYIMLKMIMSYTIATSFLFFFFFFLLSYHSNCMNGNCTDQVVGGDDVAARNKIGVLSGTPGWQKGSTSGSSCSRQSLSWRAPISSIFKPAVTRLVLSSPYASLGDQVIRDRREEDIAERSGKLVQGFQGARVRRMKLSDDHSLTRG